MVGLSGENLSEICPKLPHLASTNSSIALPAALHCLNPEPSPESVSFIPFQRGIICYTLQNSYRNLLLLLIQLTND